MTIEKHGNKWRIKQMYKGKTYTVTTDTKPGKKLAEELIMTEILERQKELPLEGSFEEYCNRYIDSKRNVLKTPSVVKYECIVRNMNKEFKEKQLSEITQEDVQILINEHSLTHMPKGTKDLHGFIASVVNLYRPSLALNTTLPEVQEDDSYEPTDEDIAVLLSYVEGSEIDVLLNLLVYGMRVSEALAIDPKTDLIDRKERTTTLLINKAKVIGLDRKYYIREENKTSKSRRKIQILNSLADKMIEKGYIYEADPPKVDKDVKKIQRHLGMEYFNPHKMRHYYATMMMDLKVPLTYIEDSGGWEHGSKSLQKRYLKTQEKKLREKQMEGVDYIDKLISNEKDAKST